MIATLADQMTTAGSQRAEAGAGVYRTQRFRALGHCFEVETADRPLGEYLDELFGAMAAASPRHDGDAAVRRYEIVEQHDGERSAWDLLADGRAVVRAAEPPTALAMLLWDVNRSVVERTGDLLLLHAAAAERDGVAVVLPGAMEAGKTTMVAGLVRAGLRYLTDEVTAIDVQRDRIHPYPKALSIDPGSWGLLGDLEPTVPRDVRRFMPQQWQVVPTSIRPDALSPAARPGAVVLPRYEPGAATRLRPLPRADALVALAGCAFRFEEDPAGTVRDLVHVVRGCESYELVHSDLDDAVRTVLGVLEGVAARAGPPTSPEPAARSSPERPPTRGERMARAINPDEIGPEFAPRRHGGVTGVELDGEMVLYSGEGAMHKLDAVAAVLWNCFDGELTVAELVDDLDSVFEGAGAERITEDVLACVRELGRQGLLENVTAGDGQR